MLPEVTKDLLAEMERRLARAVREAGRTVCGETIVSVSVGSAIFPADGISGEALLSEADRSMYELKEKHYSSIQPVP